MKLKGDCYFQAKFLEKVRYTNKLLIYLNVFRLVIVFRGVEIARAPSQLIELLWSLGIEWDNQKPKPKPKAQGNLMNSVLYTVAD